MERDKKLQKALYKRAIGFDATETVEEYSENGEGEVVLLKKKVTKKSVPPDITALKILLSDGGVDDLESLTDEELIEERERLLNELSNLKGEQF